MTVISPSADDSEAELYRDPAVFELQGGKRVYTGWIKLNTRTGKPIKNAQRMPRPKTMMAAAESIMKAGRPSVQTRSLDSTYNCVGLVFASRRTCIDISLLPFILKEDGYRPISAAEAERGDVVVYRNERGEPTHVGLVWSVEPLVAGGAPQIIVLSQWGADGEYFHRQDHVPAIYGTPSEYYTERTR